MKPLASELLAYECRPFRPCVGIMLINSDRKIFVGQRIDNSNVAWQMPQGGIDEGETPLDAAWREMLEEIGTNKAELLAEHSEWLSYSIPKSLADRLWRGQYRGQIQKWFAFGFTGHDGDINIDTSEPEFNKWRWASSESLPDLAVPFKKDVYVQIIEYFRDSL